MTGLLPWLHQTRALLLVAQDALLLLAFAGGQRPWASLALTLAAAGAEAARRQRDRSLPAGPTLVADVLLVGLFVTAWADPHSPLRMFWLVHVALAASHLPVREAYALAGLVVGVDLATALLPALAGRWGAEPGLHLGAHAATLGVGALALTAFLGRIAEARRQEAAALAQAQAERDRVARLADVGALAAGVAHELATPLASVGLLAEEIPHDPAAAEVLRGELRRCRAILDRLLARGEPGAGRTDGFPEALAGWVADWRRGNPGVPLQLDLGPLPDAVAGAPEGWRGALWTVLDNARKAGAPLAVRAGPTADGAEVAVDDAGPGLDAAALARAGEPFFSGWAAGDGRGLGLHVARRHAREAGGDLRLANRPGGGATATLALRRA